MLEGIAIEDIKKGQRCYYDSKTGQIKIFRINMDVQNE
jgi:hypothetical protein